MAGTAHTHYFARLQEADPERLRKITSLGGLAVHLKYGNDTPGLKKARAVLAAKRAAAKAGQEIEAEAGHGGAK